MKCFFVYLLLVEKKLLQCFGVNSAFCAPMQSNFFCLFLKNYIFVNLQKLACEIRNPFLVQCTTHVLIK